MTSIIKFSLLVCGSLLVLFGQGYSYPLDLLYGADDAYYYPADTGMSIYDNYPPAVGMSNYDYYNYPAVGMAAIHNQNYDENTASMLDHDGFENQSVDAAVDPSIGRSDGFNPNQRSKRQWAPIARLAVRYGRPVYRWGVRTVNAYNIGELPFRAYKAVRNWWDRK